MFTNFFLLLKNAGIPVTLREYLDLLEALSRGMVNGRIEEFYFLCRTILIKDEQYLDRFDVLFGQYFEGLEAIDNEAFREIPEEWLRKEFERFLTDEEKEQIKAIDGLDELMKRLRDLLEQQKGRHGGGNKWIGTGGTSPYGAYGYNPSGVRIGQDKNRNNRAAKVWDRREFQNLSSDVELNTRNMKMVLKRLRILTREGRPDELDIDKSIRRTSENAGFIELEMVPTRRNNVKVLIFFDVGGSMDPHIETCEQLFSAARHEFKHLEYFYFHNCLYDRVWKDNRRRRNQSIPTFELLHTYNKDYKVIFVGDASMSPYEITHAGGAVEHWNEEPGHVWMQRMKDQFPDMVWLNPLPTDYWEFTESIHILQKIFEHRMFPLSLGGLAEAMKSLKNRKITFRPGQGH